MKRVDWLVVLIAVLCAVNCSGSGCGGCGSFSPIPGGFAPDKRAANAVQVRVTPTGLASITTNPAGLLGSLAGSGSAGVIDFNVPATAGCSGSAEVCCNSMNQPISPCGPLEIDLNQYAGSPAPLTITPQQGSGELAVTVNARVKTGMDIPFVYSTLGISCGLHVDTTQGSVPYLTINMDVGFTEDATAGTTRIAASNVTISNLGSADISLTGSLECEGLSLLVGFLTSFIGDAIASELSTTVGNATCKKCASGNVADCGSPFATACTSGVCEEGSACLQELGIDGLASNNSLVGTFSPTTTGGLELYEVAGGYATTDNGGISLGMLGGMEPGGSARDRCGPLAAEPALASIPQSPTFQGNTYNGSAFDIGIGIHESQLAQFAYAGYDGGLICLTIGHSTVSELTTDTISLLARSLQHLVYKSSPMEIGLRPQSPPTIALGSNTFSNGMLQDPLLDVRFSALQIDFLAEVNQQYVRVFTVVADVHLPVGLQVGGTGELTPVIGNPSDAFTNISVINADGVTESPASLAQLFPSILGLVLPQLSNGIGAIAVPSLAGITLDIQAITSTDNNTFLALFANIGTGSAAAPVHTTAVVTSIEMPDPTVTKDPTKWASARPPAVTLALGADAPDAADIEYSIRLDGGAWSAWSTNAHPTLSPVTFWLPGIHHADVRARRVGRPSTIDTNPLHLALAIGVTMPPTTAGPTATAAAPAAGGCACDTRGSGGSGTGALVVVVLAALVLPLRRMGRRLVKLKLGATVWLAALACLPGCSCDSKPCGPEKCMEGEVAHDPGQWTSVAGDDKRLLVATYDPALGDLVVIDETNQQKPAYTVVDGVPSGQTPTYDPSTYRGGISQAGPNVGAWPSIAIANHLANVAYQDLDQLALKFAYEDSSHHWTDYVVDDGSGGDNPTGEYAHLVFDTSGNPAIAYLALGVDDGMGHRDTHLQLARASSPNPTSMSDWTITTISSQVGTCAGFCATGEACVAGSGSGSGSANPEVCAAPTTDCTTMCGSADTCVAGTCRATYTDPMLDDVPTGTGLWVKLDFLPSGQVAATYYDATRKALVLGLQSAPNSPTYAETILDGNATGLDRGQWASSVVGSDGTIHIAYKDGIGSQLMYTTWKGGTVGTPVVVDDGERPNDRPHPVGAGAVIYLDNGTPTIAYQDGLAGFVDVASQSGSAWTMTPLTAGKSAAGGAQLDGFSVGEAVAPSGDVTLAWDARVPANSLENIVVVQAP
jgi:hypothetical protein